ncbi:CLUMA_CG019565, isoform A [Clunio marinus]|uniref:CLUMA_CG019565, isoform A n=1 Tax=Clunio marinus TaxID=568069 RepID=A0A1J1J5S3_9DIPT|nr:CLUMA_CG019565, isoform A [Clunio marinus]
MSSPMKLFFILRQVPALIFLTAFAMINFLNLVSCITLIVGALKKKKNCLLPYLVLTSLYILIYVALGVWFFMRAKEHQTRNGVITILVICINIYCLIVVYRLYGLLKLRERNYPAFLRETNRQQQIAQNYETTYVKIP